MSDSTNVVESFYRFFQNKDWRGMQSLYHDDIVFSDPVFQNLKGKEAKAMWHMLAEAARDLTITYRDAKVEGSTGSCHWEAAYDFSRTGRKVHNVIDASFELKEGKIIRHTDTFDLWKWAAMALGMSGKLLGWTPYLQSKVRTTARTGLDKFIASHQEYRT